uniref:uncharacterized protein LOC122583133 n=1 Tax=Erigeron canadensis TaxID=72917 RepID=UPI001CB99E02|nr:uncharacterized protein LOC122583133 [Erigeron canadensis]
MKPVLGMKFESPEQLKFSLVNYVVANGYQFWYYKNDCQSLLVKCDRNMEEGRCSSKKGNKNKIVGRQARNLKMGKGSTEKKIKTLIDEDYCLRKYNLGPLVTCKWIAVHYAKRILEDRKLTYRTLQRDIKERFLIDVSLGQCKKGKLWALHDYGGGLKEHYAKLWDYRQELLRSNPSSTIALDVDSDGSPYFNRMYICFKGVKDGWLSGCRKVIGIDGCFLKSTVTGMLLTAVGRDANNQMYPIAWAVAGAENKDTWNWFLSLLHDDLSLNEGTNLTIFSDGHKDCWKQLVHGFPMQNTGNVNLFWDAAYATIEEHFLNRMEEIKNMDQMAYDYLIERNPNTWCRAFFQMDRSCATFENGIVESFNSKLVDVRHKPIITMFEEIRVYVMQRLVTMSKLAIDLEDSICPSIRKHKEVMKTQSARYWRLMVSGYQEYEVYKVDDSLDVNLQTKKCDYRMWELSGLPCVHAVAAYMFIKMDPTEGVSPWFEKAKWQDAYAYSIRPVRGSTHWRKVRNEPPLPPIQKKMPGRPKKKRVRHATEDPIRVSRVGRQMTCKICNEKGHTRRTCKLKPSSSSAAQETQQMEEDADPIPQEMDRNAEHDEHVHMEEGADPIPQKMDRNAEHDEHVHMEEEMDRNAEMDTNVEEHLDDFATQEDQNDFATQEDQNMSQSSNKRKKPKRRNPSQRIARMKLAKVVVAKDGSGTSSKPIVME